MLRPTPIQQRLEAIKATQKNIKNHAKYSHALAQDEKLANEQHHLEQQLKENAPQQEAKSQSHPQSQSTPFNRATQVLLQQDLIKLLTLYQD